MTDVDTSPATSPAAIDAVPLRHPWRWVAAVVIVRLLDNSLNTVYAVSTAAGTTARFTQQVEPGPYQVDIFLNQGPGRTATFNLEIKHP